MSKESADRIRHNVREWILVVITGMSVAFACYQARITEHTRRDAKSASDKQYELAKHDAEQSVLQFQQQWGFERQQANEASARELRSFNIATANLREAERSLHNQITALHLAERPYITVSSVYVEPYIHKTFIEPEGPIHENIPGKFHVTLHTHGGSPARNVRFSYECRSGVWQVSQDMKPYDGVTVENGDLAPVAVFAPNTDYEFVCQPNQGGGVPKDVKFSSAVPDDIWAAGSRVLVHDGGIRITGKVVYSDLFNETHETAFCFQSRDGMFDRGGRLDFCGKGNETF